MTDDSIETKLAAHSLHEEDPASSDDETTNVGSKYAKREWRIQFSNPTTYALQLSAWPVRPSAHSAHTLSTFRGEAFHSSVPEHGTTSADNEFLVGVIRGPKHLDPRKRCGWIYVDLVKTDGSKVHLQVCVKLDRKGVEEALVGRADLDSSEKKPMPSGTLGKGLVSKEDRTITFEVTEELAEAGNVVDDSTKKASRILVGKGIATVTYVSSELGRASLIVGKEARYHEYEKPIPPNFLPEFKTSLHEIEGVASREIAAFVDYDGVNLWSGTIKINPLTGDASGSGFNSTSKTTVQFHNGLVLNYGFHDAGQKRHDQLYGYLTPDHSSWLGDLIASDPTWLKLPFGTLALPAAHDSGMFGPLDAGLATLIQEGHLGNALASHTQDKLAAPVVHLAVNALEFVKLRPERVINNIALTQKDNFDDQLKIGVRFFDFRPGFCFSDVIHLRKGRIHHQHAMVPGCEYVTFLTAVLNFLSTHPQEIVISELKSDGFVVSKDKYHTSHGGTPVLQVYSMIPSEAELEGCWQEARRATDDGGRRVVMGSAADMGKTIGDLLDEEKRFIVIDRVHHPDDWLRDDSYDHVAYNTTNPATILAALEKTHAQSSHPDGETAKPPRGCIYQLQATPTANIVDDIKTSLTYSDASSLLTYMKPQQDQACYPWIASHDFKEPGNVVFLNDFVDGCLVEHCVHVSKKRAGL